MALDVNKTAKDLSDMYDDFAVNYVEGEFLPKMAKILDDAFQGADTSTKQIDITTPKGTLDLTGADTIAGPAIIAAAIGKYFALCVVPGDPLVPANSVSAIVPLVPPAVVSITAGITSVMSSGTTIPYVDFVDAIFTGVKLIKFNGAEVTPPGVSIPIVGSIS